MKKIIYCIYFQLVFLSIFTDYRLEEQLGIFGRCLLNMLIPVYLIMILGVTRKLFINIYIKQMLYLLTYLIFYTFVVDMIWALSGKDIVLFGENIFIKSCKTISYWLLIIIYMLCIYMCIKCVDVKNALKPFVFTYFFLFVYLLLELRTIPYAFHIGLRAGEYYERVRLTSTEASGTAPLIVTFGIATLIYFYHKKSKLGLGATFGSLFIFLLTTGAKSIYLLVIVTLLIFFFYTLKEIKRQYIYIIGGVVILALVIGGYYVDKLIKLTASYRGSYGIRGIQIIAGLYHILKYPFGVGGGIYIDTLRRSAIQVYKTLGNSNLLGHFFSSNWEVNEFLKGSTDNNITIFAGMMQQSLFWGVFGTAYWLKKTYDYLHCERNCRKFVLMCTQIFLACVVTMFFSTTAIYNQYMIFALLIVLGEYGQYFGNRNFIEQERESEYG